MATQGRSHSSMQAHYHKTEPEKSDGVIMVCWGIGRKRLGRPPCPGLGLPSSRRRRKACLDSIIECDVEKHDLIPTSIPIDYFLWFIGSFSSRSVIDSFALSNLIGQAIAAIESTIRRIREDATGGESAMANSSANRTAHDMSRL